MYWRIIVGEHKLVYHGREHILAYHDWHVMEKENLFFGGVGVMFSVFSSVADRSVRIRIIFPDLGPLQRCFRIRILL
jgi:hypothetical protein